VAGFAVIALVALGAVTACGKGTNGAGEPSPATSSSAPAGLSPESLRTISSYVGVPSGKATGAPIRVGLVNTESGAAASPESTLGVEEAVRSVNEYFGGVKGRPIELRKCLPADAAQTLRCAQDFAADPATVAVLQGTLDADLQGFHAALAPKVPVLGHLPLSPVDAAAPNAYYLSGGQFSVLGVVSYARDFVKAKKVALIAVAGFAATELAISTLENAMKAVGISVTVAKFPYDSTDLTQALAASRAQEADLLIPAVTSPQQCVGLSNAVQQMGIDTPILAFTGCLGADVAKSLGDYPRWQFMAFTISPEADAPDDLTAWQVRAFNEWYRPLEGRGLTRNSGVHMFQLVLTLSKLLNAVPGDTPTAAAASAQIKRFTGPVFLGVPRLAFGAIPGLPALGSLSSRVYVYLGNGSWGDTTGGAWLEPPNIPTTVGSGRR
jgi:branched-chain amino acid transport system substrate-binding protein